MFGFLDARAADLLLLLGWLLAPSLAGWAFVALKVLLDRLHADSLPRSTREWLGEGMKRLGLKDLEIVLGPANLWAFAPLAKAIVLDERTARKKDPIFWAIGTHELGHASFYRYGFLALPLRVCRLGWTTVSPLARFALVGCLLYGGVQLLHDTLRTLLLVGLGALVVVLLDEIAASIVAMVMLARSGALTFGQLAGAAATLLFAFGTYAATAAADLLLYLHLDAFRALTDTHVRFVAGGGHGWAVRIGLIVATIVLAFSGLRSMVFVFLSVGDWAKLKDDAAHIAAALFVLVCFGLATTPVGKVLCVLTLPLAWKGAVAVAIAPLAFVVARVDALRSWAVDKREEAMNVGILALVQLSRSQLERALAVAPWGFALAFVTWYWVS